MKSARRTLLWLGAYAAAMAWVESVLVVYLRRLYYPDDPLTMFPLRIWPMRDLALELVREAATIAMILAVARLAVQGRIRRTAAFLFVFGVWDLCYYLWLKVALGWPVSWAEWDVLFLIPWPWLAPWITPAIAAALFVLWAAPVLDREEEIEVPRRARALAVAGLALMLAAFVAPALPLLGADAATIASFVPHRFPWWLYLPGVALLAAGLFAGRAGGCRD
ncbi:MAG TPA: hypothetical protein VI078_05595 [bacterium]